MTDPRIIEAIARHLASTSGHNPDLVLSADKCWPTVPSAGETGVPLWQRLFREQAEQILGAIEGAGGQVIMLGPD